MKKIMYRIYVKQTEELHHTQTESEAIKWMKHCQKVARIWGGEPTFEVEKITTESIFLNLNNL